jgi:hypothetical protein
MVPTGLLNDLIRSANQIDRGRNGFTVNGEEHNGRINYERGAEKLLFVATFLFEQQRSDAHRFRRVLGRGK